MKHHIKPSRRAYYTKLLLKYVTAPLSPEKKRHPSLRINKVKRNTRKKLAAKEQLRLYDVPQGFEIALAGGFAPSLDHPDQKPDKNMDACIADMYCLDQGCPSIAFR